MPSGSCLCGAVKIEYTQEPIAKALCHCTDCRKITGSTYSTNAVVPQDGFKVTSGKPKVFSKTADSGNKIHSYFCGDCGTTLYRDGDSFNGAKIVKAGVLDDYAALNNAKPAVELYAPERVDWVVPVPGADQKQGMS
ncbi:hypothetical protein H2203_008219 [Taxawa tesnikishii (nom. ined.)]|nr:hypothetical protein H2203_008219 [Dothideales sp. JES 119]